MLTPADVHYGRGEEILARRAEVLRAAFEANPRRFKGRAPARATLPSAVWINPPEENSAEPTDPAVALAPSMGTGSEMSSF